MLNTLLNLCRLRGGPQDLPSSQQLLIMLAAASVITKVLPRLGDFPVGTLLFASIVKTALMLGILFLILRMNDKVARFVQTATAICGVLTIIQLVTTPIFVRFLDAMSKTGALTPETAASMPPEMAFGNLIWMLVIVAIGVWSIACIANIVRHAFEVPMGRAIFITLSMMVLSEIVTLMIAAPFAGESLPAAS